MRVLSCLIVAAGVLATAAQAQDRPSSSAGAYDNGMPCVEVQIGQDRASHIDCLNEALRRSVEREKTAPLPEAPIDARSASNQVGTANIAAAQQMMGNAFGVSAVPQRPHPTFANPLISR